MGPMWGGGSWKSSGSMEWRIENNRMRCPPSNFIRPHLLVLPPGETCILTTSPIPTPSFPNPPSTAFSVLSRILIKVPSNLVHTTIVTTGEYFKWNTFAPRCSNGQPMFYNELELFQLNKLTEMYRKESQLMWSNDTLSFSMNLDNTRLQEIVTPFIDTENFNAWMDESKKVDSWMESSYLVKYNEPLEMKNEAGRKGWRIVWTSITTMGGLLGSE